MADSYRFVSLFVLKGLTLACISTQLHIYNVPSVF